MFTFLRNLFKKEQPRLPGRMGRLARKEHPKTLKLSNYLTATELPAPAEKVWREYKIPAGAWQMFGNDQVGDCTCAAIAHMLMLITAHTGEMVVPTLQEVLDAYSAITGYNQGTGANDNGAAISDVLNYWQTTGLAGHKILGWVEIDHTNITRVKQGVQIFGAVDLGVNLPNVAMDQFTKGQSWDIVKKDGGNDGGHCVPSFGYGKDGANCITWAQRQPFSWAWHAKYCDEAYVVVTEDWLKKADELTLGGLNLDQLNTDLKLIKA